VRRTLVAAAAVVVVVVVVVRCLVALAALRWRRGRDEEHCDPWTA
jgi:hypothetical protein